MHITYTATTLSPLHHGAGTAGNTQLQRTTDVILPDGTATTVPLPLSGNAFRHTLREALAHHTLATIGAPEGSLTKGEVDLLFSGGGISVTGSQVDLQLTRDVDALYPALTLLGYSAQSDIVSGVLRASPVGLVCAENANRLPVTLAAIPQATKPAALYLDEDFGTRHDIASTPVARFIDLATGGASKQMIWSTQIIKPGSILWGDLWLTPAASADHARVLAAALALAFPGGRGHVGAKSAQGYGHIQIDGLPAEITDALTWWTGHLADHAEQITDLIRKVVGA